MTIIIKCNTIEFRRDDGTISVLDCGGEKVTFSGNVPVDVSADEFTEALDKQYICKIQAEKDKLKEQVIQLLIDKGLIRQETDDPVGVWETSAGVKFGKNLVEQIRVL